MCAGKRCFPALAVLLVLVSLSLDSCLKKPIEKTTNTPGTPFDTSGAHEDTTKGFFSEQYDSLTHKFTSFFKSLLPPGKDTTHGHPVLTPPPSGITPPTATTQPPALPGFIPNPVKPEVQFDTSGNVTQRNVYLGSDVRTPVTTPLEDYLQAEENAQLLNGYNAQVHHTYDTGTAVDQQTGILGNYNSISIPIPPSIVPTIFGRPSINLRVNGDVGIHLAYRDQQTYATAGSNFFGSETGLDFKQEINVNVNGTIGDKLKIGADWGSDRMFQYDNLLNFNYKGYPDEILQEFDAGNITFNTPSKYIGLNQDLFGLKAITRFGPLYVTTVAAQKKGERQSKSFGGGAGAATEHIIRPWDYRRNRFFLDTSYIKDYEQYYSTIPPNNSSLEAPTNVQVWVSTKNNQDPRVRRAVAYYSLAPKSGGNYSLLTSGSGNPTSQSVVGGYWLKMDSTRYTVLPDGELVLNQDPDDQTALAVSYTAQPSNEQFGDDIWQTSDSILVLKLIKPANAFQNVNDSEWKLIVKSTYYIGGINFDPSSFSARLYVQLPGGHQNEYMAVGNPKTEREPKALTVTGLDRYNNSDVGNRTPDGLIDYNSQFGGGKPGQDYIVDATSGTIVFPYLEPFGDVIDNYNTREAKKAPASAPYTKDTNFYVPEIYNTPQEVLRLRETKLVALDVKYTGGVSSTMQLGAFNLVQGSVRVTIGGRQLVEGTDFRVDYNSGTVTLLDPTLINSGQINVEYDVHDIFTNATKNILALRGELPIFDESANQKGYIATTLMNYSMSLPTLKTHQGEEPLSNWVWGADGNYNWEAPWLTSAMNALPIFNLSGKSYLDVKLDGALSMPNPNTEKSPMPVDNGASIAYLDDFEGGLNEFPLYLNYGRWVPSSQPADSLFKAQRMSPNFNGKDSEYWLNPINQLKGKTAWWTPKTRTPLQVIKPNETPSITGQTATTMTYYFDPTHPGIYNPIPDTAAFGTDSMWGGMMQYAPGLNVAATNTDAIQLYIKIDQINALDQNDSLTFDIGQISDDIIPDHKLETEDKARNGRYQPGEDIGLDGLTTSDEQKMWPNAYNPSDPSNDDYSSDGDPPLNINGQEGNENDYYSGLIPDHEDLDGSGSVSLDNAYYEYKIPLNPSNKYVIGGNPSQGWFQLRIPLADYARIVGTQDSSFSNINYYRLWSSGFTHPVQVELFEFMLVGSQWSRGSVGLNPLNPVGDQSLKIGYVNVWDNSGYYTPPPGAQTTLVPSSTTYVPGNEQSLLMHLDNVENTGRREATRVFPDPNDLFNYTQMAIWVHGNDSDNAQNPISKTPVQSMADTANRVWVYWRFGTDAYDYYEYRMPLQRNWQNMHVNFSNLTALKAQMAANQNSISRVDPNVPYAIESVVGRPTLTDAPYFVLGVQNETGQRLTTDVWWDELRLLAANDKMGLAWNGAAKLQLAEFGNITGSIVDESADFHRVDERFNTTRSTTFDWNVIGQFGLEKMLPKSMEQMNSKLPLTISHAETILTPEYIVNTDESLSGAMTAVGAATNLSAAQKSEIIDSLLTNNQTLDVKNSIGSSDIALRFPGSFFLLPVLINRLDFGFGYTEEYLRSPVYQYDYNFAWTFSGRYSLPPLPGLGLQPFRWWGNTTPIIGPYADWKINLLPSNVSFAIAATRGRSHSLTQLSTLTLPTGGSALDSEAVLNSRVPIVNRVFTATRGMQINWKPFEGGMLTPNFDYALDVSSNLAGLETNAQLNRPTTYDANGNPIYNYDSVYLFQRDFKDILHDIFFQQGQFARLGVDYSANQRVHMSTFPRLPGLWGLEKLVRPVFDYSVDYKWLNAQTGLQNAKQAAWNNSITTGIEFNVRELGEMIFGKPAEAEQQQRGMERGRFGERNVGVTPERVPERGFEERQSPPAPPSRENRNQVLRGEHMRPQEQPNPLGEPTFVTDTLHLPNGQIGSVVVDTTKVHIAGVGTEGQNDREYVIDTTITAEAPPIVQPTPPEEAEAQPETPPLTVKQLLQDVVEKPLFDWNGTRFNFTQTNASLNNALAGVGSGISNFLAKGIFTPEDDQNGPSRAYQLGLITDPAGRLIFHWNNRFPWLSFSVRHGLRAQDPFGGSVDVTDAFNQQNNFELSTSRPLWNGASISLNWKLSFGFSERDALQILSDGVPNPLYTVKSGDVSRTFLSIPPLPFLGSAFQSGILNVGAKYQQYAVNALNAAGRNFDPTTSRDTARFLLSAGQHNKIEQDAFMQGFETLPLFSAAIQEFLPRLNWSFNWSGLEKFPLFSFADHASFRDAYSGTYQRSFQQNPGDVLDLTNLQTVIYGFQPLIGLDMSWDKLWGGRFSTNVNYSTQTQWAADYSSARITRQLSTTFGITANYSREGLIIPFLKLNLKNQLGGSFTLSETISQDSYFNFWNITDANGISNGGLTKITIEPRVTYNVSSQFTMEAFYHYERTTPAASGLISPPTRLIEAGLDIKLKIQ